MADEGVLRIGELSKRSGVSPELLRAWERRYALLRPSRSAGGLRLYTPADLERVRRMQHHLADGLAAAEAAALAGRPDAAEPPERSPVALRRRLAEALDRFDEPAAQTVLDEALAAVTSDTLLGEIVLPYLQELGSRWADGTASIAQEHFASNVLRGRLLGMARGWGLGLGPTAVLACPPGEQHDLALLAFGLALRARGWRIVYLGADTPLETVADAAARVGVAVVVLSAIDGERLRPLTAALRDYRLAIAGPAAATDFGPGVLSLTGDPIAEAERMTAATG